VWVGAAVPGAWLLLDALTGGLGANPVESVTHRTGLTALTLLALSLSVRPTRDLLRFGALMPLRRTLGLAAYTYAVVHVLTYGVDQTYLSGLGVSPAAIVEDVRERPYVTMGFLAFVLLTPLAVTSTSGWVKRLGATRWRWLHRLVYLAAPLAVVHFLWLVKADLLLPSLFALAVAVLLGYRVAQSRRKRTARMSGQGVQPPSQVEVAPGEISMRGEEPSQS
jgi:sulfoxide reductase heme-binding subunit YedZ